MPANADQNNFEYGHFLRSVSYLKEAFTVYTTDDIFQTTSTGSFADWV